MDGCGGWRELEKLRLLENESLPAHADAFVAQELLRSPALEKAVPATAQEQAVPATAQEQAVPAAFPHARAQPAREAVQGKPL